MLQHVTARQCKSDKIPAWRGELGTLTVSPTPRRKATVNDSSWERERRFFIKGVAMGRTMVFQWTATPPRPYWQHKANLKGSKQNRTEDPNSVWEGRGGGAEGVGGRA